MTTEFIWQLPTASDARPADARRFKRAERLPGDARPYAETVTDPRGERFNYFDYLHQITRAAELAGFDGIQIQHDLDGDESWIVAGYLARSTRRLRLLTEFEAARGSAVYAAKNAVSYQRFTGNRFSWQITQGGSTEDRRRQGDFVADEQLLQRIDEFLITAKGVITEAPFSFKGDFFEVLEGGFRGPLGGNPVPQVYLSGKTDEAYALSVRQADVHVFDAVPVAELAEAVDQVQALADQAGRSLAFGLRIDILARETEEEALQDARRYWQQSGIVDAETRQPVVPGLWSLPSSHTGAAASLIGSYEQVTEALVAYAQVGIEHFILGASPHLEEAYRFGEHVLPAVRSKLADLSPIAA